MVLLPAHVSEFCEAHGLLPRGAFVVVAVSGGPDSLCLLHVLLQLASQRELQLHVAHLDHQLRPNSADDARFVADTAADWNVSVTIAQVDVAAMADTADVGIEAAARTARLQFLAQTAQTVDAGFIALGHTLDDQAETVLMRLMRGAGPSGLAAMRPRRVLSEVQDVPSLMLVRPLLATTRAEVEAYCAEHRLQPRHDPSNESPIFLRNRVRGYILPLLKTYNPSIVAALARTARACAEENDLLDQLQQAAWVEMALVDEAGIKLDRQRFEGLHPALQRRTLRQAVQQLDSTVELEAKHIDIVLTALANNRRRVQLPHNVWLKIESKRLLFTVAELGDDGQ